MEKEILVHLYFTKGSTINIITSQVPFINDEKPRELFFVLHLDEYKKQKYLVFCEIC